VVEAGLGIPGLRDLHPEFAIICRIYASECASLPGFLKSVEDQLATQSVFHTDKTAQEDYCSKAFLCVARAFICGLRGGAAPMAPNPLDDPHVRRGVCLFTCAGSDFAGCPRLAAGATDSRRFHLVVTSTCEFTSSAAAGYARVGNLLRPAHI
jgi:hypothetical protein